MFGISRSTLFRTLKILKNQESRQRDQITAASIEGGLNFLLDEREKDPERSLLKRLSPWGP
jgi:hypothetical protein